MTLVGLPINDFVKRLADGSPTPGGGSVAALAGSLGAALCAMVSRITLAKEKYKDAWEKMERVRDSADQLARRLLELADRDTEAYNQVVAAFRLPKKDGAQEAARSHAIQEATKRAALIPMETLREVARLVDLVGEALDKGNPNCITDAGVAVQLVRAAAMGAAYNVRINLSDVMDKGFTSRLETEVTELVAQITKSADRISEAVERALG
ncbi:MAG: cyclodeaminase/cyclohydrolase family protein [Candidatus Binatia bacterium]